MGPQQGGGEMAGINTGKVVAGGLLAGLVMNIGDIFINVVLLAAEFRAGLERLGLDPVAAESGSVMATWITVDFLLGIVLVWSYAAMRPRFGPGPKTAILAAIPLFAGITLIMFGLTVMGFFTMGLFAKSTVCSAVNAAISAVAGAWLYREA
jgi:hypothetical protein